jgi:hypothetical protein
MDAAPSRQMPSVAVEEAARDHVYHLRTRDVPLHTFGPGNYVLTPLVRNLDNAVAALLEHFTDIGGGVEGVTETCAVLIDYAMRLPGAAFNSDDGPSPALEHARAGLRFESVLRPETPALT